MKNSIAATTVIVVVAALAWTARALLPDPPAAPEHRARDATAAMPAAPERPVLPRLAPLARIAADEPRADATAADKASDPAAVAPAPTSAQVRDRLDDAFRTDPIDAAWSQTAVRTLQAKLGPLLPPQSAVRSVDCRGSLCRIETSHAGVTEYRDFVQRTFLGQAELWNAGFFTNVVADPVPGQPVITVAYLAREGQSLPSPEALFGAR
jgi:hypothetical protein